MKPTSIRAAYALLTVCSDFPDDLGPQEPVDLTDVETLPAMCEAGRMSLVAKWAFPLSGTMGAIVVDVEGWLIWKVYGRLINCATSMLTPTDLTTIATWTQGLSTLMLRLESTILSAEAGQDLRVGMVVERAQLWRPKGVGVEYTVGTTRWRLYAGTAPGKIRDDGEQIDPKLAKPLAVFRTVDGFWQPAYLPTIPLDHLTAKAELILPEHLTVK